MPEKKLADRLREAIRLRGYSIRTEKAYISWYERYARLHAPRAGAQMPGRRQTLGMAIPLAWMLPDRAVVYVRRGPRMV